MLPGFLMRHCQHCSFLSKELHIFSPVNESLNLLKVIVYQFRFRRRIAVVNTMSFVHERHDKKGYEEKSNLF